MLGADGFWRSELGERARREQAAQIAIASFADAAELSLPPLEFRLGTSPIQAEKSLPDRNAFDRQRWRPERSPVLDRRQVYRRAAGLLHWIDAEAMIIRSNWRICLQHLQLGAERGDTGAGNLGQPLVTCIGSDAEQLLDTIASDRRDDPDSAR